MRNLVVGLCLAVAFAIGCVSSRYVVRPAGAETAATSAQWEYLCVDAYSGITHSANQLGKQGWEMSAAAGTSDHMMWCFKRQLR